MSPTRASFEIIGPADPVSPVVLSVPHAGRDYPLALRSALRAPLTALRALEDRHVDAVALAARRTETLLVQRLPRAWIDLNRAEHERDPKLDTGAAALRQPIQSAKLRSGLGLVPRRTPQAGDLWRRTLSGDEVDARIRADHRPFHAAVARALDVAHARFGVAVLLDIHSMPSLASGASIVLGDRFGRAAAGRFMQRLEDEARQAGYACALNAPYAGGHILDTHGAPRRGVHAIQLEFDRTLYLDAALAEPGRGMAATVALLRAMIDALADEAVGSGQAQAAE